ncbi:hypothetical protein G5714_019832 [Onychostoma macrolepis]|uniref:Gypsy retrotransposon integrase-like protein 1 n=1 Tax=Onychostoma macrolepis TaxID=369639 RepID=A0A7J6BXJ6_9TELE|nr:hypothetical protein G5714_019832 [Onychostoma macrolepis]
MGTVWMETGVQRGRNADPALSRTNECEWLEQHDNTGLEGGDVLLRDQYVMGLQEEPIQQELRAQVQRDRQLTFEDVRKQVLALESERQDLWAPPTPVFTQNVAVEPAFDWKQTFHRELMQEVKEQFTEMSKTFFEELHQNRSSVTNYPHDELYLAQASGSRRAPGHPVNDRFKWDAQVPQVAVGQLNVAMVEAPGGHPCDTPSGWEWDPQHWRDLQGQDAVLRKVLNYVEAGSLPLRAERLAQPKDVQKLLGHWNRLCLKEGVLCRLRQDSETQEMVQQIVVPQTQKQSLLEAYHSQMGHQGVETLSLLQRHFSWP